jgi:hypothetical protein
VSTTTTLPTGPSKLAPCSHWRDFSGPGTSRRLLILRPGLRGSVSLIQSSRVLVSRSFAPGCAVWTVGPGLFEKDLVPVRSTINQERVLEDSALLLSGREGKLQQRQRQVLLQGRIFKINLLVDLVNFLNLCCCCCSYYLLVAPLLESKKRIVKIIPKQETSFPRSKLFKKS